MNTFIFRINGSAISSKTFAAIQFLSLSTRLVSFPEMIL